MRDFDAWCRTVTDHVRFRPDRAEIAEELAAHYEDHVKDLKRLGYDRALAEQRALGAMGDPEEIGRAMDRIHEPWLGWLWLVSKWALVVCLLLTVFSIGSDLDRFSSFFHPAQREGDYEPDGFFFFSEGNPERDESLRILRGSGSSTVERCGDVFSIPYAAVWEDTYNDAYWITVVLAADDRNPFDDTLYRFIGDLRVTFDDGRYYDRHYYDMPVGYDETGAAIWGPADGFLGGLDCYESDPFRSLYRMWIRVADLGAGMELSYPHGDPWSIPIDWEAEP